MSIELETIFGLLGGLALFIFGMNTMSEGLQKTAGDRMKSILAMLTKNPLLGVCAGAAATAVMQSSSATTVMVIGFVSAGLMSMPQAVSVILGANIGTTLTAQLIAFKLSDYIWPIVFVGFLIWFVAREERLKNIGQTIFAFGLLFVGIETMGEVMKPLAASPAFMSMIADVKDTPILGVLVGTVMTVVVQSSSATIAVLQNFASQAGPDGISSVLGLQGAIPILFGDNIGTTITAFIASLGQSKSAKRTAAAHSTFNITGSLLFICFIPAFSKVVQLISPQGPEIDIIARQIANAHTLFNVACTILWLPFIAVLVKIATFIIPGEDEEPREEGEVLDESRRALNLDDKVMMQPVFAIEVLTREMDRLGTTIKGMLPSLSRAIIYSDRNQLAAVRVEERFVEKGSEEVADYIRRLLGNRALTEEQTASLADTLLVLGHLRRIAARYNEIALLIEDKLDHGYHFTDEAKEELQRNMSLTSNMYNSVLDYLQSHEPLPHESIDIRRQKIIKERNRSKKNHIKRLATDMCKREHSRIFDGLLFTLERITNECFNLMESEIEFYGRSANEITGSIDVMK